MNIVDKMMDEISPKKLLQNSFFLSHFLSIKYGNTEENYEIMLIDALVFSLSSHYNSIYKEEVISNDNDEYLKRKYDKRESLFKIPRLASYYQSYLQFFALPLFRNFTYGSIMQINGDQKAEIFYKRTYSSKHEKKANDNNNNHNISINQTLDNHIEREVFEENKTIFDFTSRKTIEKFGISSFDFISNQFNAKNELVLGNYCNENLFYSKRSNKEDSLICIVNYMNKNNAPKGNNCNRFKNKLHSLKAEYNDAITNNKLNKRCILFKAGQSQKVIHVEKPSKELLMNTYCSSIRGSKPSCSLSIKTSKELIKVVSSKISQSSNMTETNHQTPSFTKNSKLDINHNSQIKHPKTSKNSFSCSNGARTEINMSRNNHSKQSTISKFLSSHLSKNTSPKQKTTFGLYKKSTSKPSQQPTNQINFLNYLNNCTSSLAKTTQSIADLLISKRFKVKDKSSSIQSKKAKHTIQLEHKSKKENHNDHRKNTTRNFVTPIFKNTLFTNYIIENQSSSAAIMQKENYNNNRTTNSKINVHLTMNTPSNFKTTNNSLAIAKLNSSERNKTLSQPKNKISHDEKRRKPTSFATYSHHNTISNSNTSIFTNLNLLLKIKDLKNELKGKYTQQITKRKDIESNRRKTSITDAIKSNVTSKDRNYMYCSLLESNNIQSLNKTKNERIIVNRMRELKSMNHNSNYSNEKHYCKKKNKEKEDSTWSKSEVSNGIKGIGSDLSSH